MSNDREEDENVFRKKLTSQHFWNALLVSLLALSGLVMFSDFWRAVLGEARAWIKWLHIIIGFVSIVPVLYYLPIIASHWKLLKGKFWQRVNVVVVLLLLLCWIFSGALLWQFRAVGPAVPMLPCWFMIYRLGLGFHSLFIIL